MRREFVGDGFQLFVTPAKIPAGPVQLPQTIQHRAFDPMLGVALEQDVLAFVELLGAVDQPQHTGVNEIVEIGVYGKTLVQPDRNGFD